MSRINDETSLELHLLKGQTKAIVCLSGHLTIDTVGKLAGLSPKLGEPRLVELDLSDLKDIDEDGVRALQFLERRLAGRGSLFLLSHPRPSVRRRLSRGGIRSLLAPSFPRRRVTSVVAVDDPNAFQAG
jgi:anti-anti-sigma regulatory factor